MQAGKVTQYFPGSNTALGFYSLWNNNIDDLPKLIILKGGPGTGKSTILSKLVREFQEEDWDTELLWCSSDAESLDGVIFRRIGLGIIDGTAPHLRDPRYPGVVDRLINLGDYWSVKELLQNKDEIIRLTNENSASYKVAYHNLAEAKKHHEHLKDLYKSGMNWEEITRKTDELIQHLFSSFPTEYSGQERHRFLGALTPQGPVNYASQLLDKATIRYIIKGPPGTGKSTLTKRIAEGAKNKGFAVDYYHCGLDPFCIDSILIPELGLCVLNSTAPHDIAPGPRDTVIDLFSLMSGQIYSNNLAEIELTNSRFTDYYSQALANLKNCKAYHDQLEKCYAVAMDFQKVEILTAELRAEILEIKTSLEKS